MPSDRRPEDGDRSTPLEVVVVGGGTAGWMTAAALAAMLPGLVRITLVESEEIGIVGVGEATLPQIRAFNARIGLNEAAFMRATRATFKLGIEFRDWARFGDSYIHPFGIYGEEVNGVAFHHYWLRMREAAGPLEDYSLAIVAARAARFGFPDEDTLKLEGSYGYAYQFDATRYAPLLRAEAEAKGVMRREGRIVDAEVDGDTVRAVILADGPRIAGDLFVDCSGFRSLLLGDKLGEPFEDWSEWLPCDRAVALPCEGEGRLSPYTTATAMPAGWRWRIPLQHRVGNGYVFSSAFVDEAAAADAVLASIEGKPLADPRVLRFKAGRRRRAWVGNVVGVGLAGGFLEPLESTSIYLIQVAITTLVELFPERDIAAVDRDEFNRLVNLEYDRIRDFLILHYHATERDDSPFWNHVRTMTVPDSLLEKMELFRRRGRVVRYKEGVFLEPSWIAVYLGQGIEPEGHDPRADLPSDAALAGAIGRLRDRTRMAGAAMLDHAAFIQRHGAAVA